MTERTPSDTPRQDPPESGEHRETDATVVSAPENGRVVFELDRGSAPYEAWAPPELEHLLQPGADAVLYLDVMGRPFAYFLPEARIGVSEDVPTDARPEK